MAVAQAEPVYWRMSASTWGVLGAMTIPLGVVYYDALLDMISTWFSREEYSHGVLIPLIAAYLVWQRSGDLARIEFGGSWMGIVFALLGISIYVLGEFSTIPVLIQYGFLATLYGVVFSFVGWRGFRILAIPLLILFFMIPLPAFIYSNLSAKLQLVSSEIGVLFIRLFDISVYLEGNVIDLGSYKLQVVEACDGLRYLFPLMTLGFIVAYFFEAPLWKRIVVFVSTIPVTILMNSFRIGVIGVMVEYWGQSMAEGFLHDFEGWVVFMACFGILFVEMWLLLRLTGDRRPFRSAFGIEAPGSPQPQQARVSRRVPAPLVGAVVLLVLAAYPASVLPERVDLLPGRSTFASFPLDIADWEGHGGKLEAIYLDALKLTDYALINYRNDAGYTVNFYSAFYASQRKGQSAHSPRSCLPGGGWKVDSLTQRRVDGASINGVPLEVNRVQISQGDNRKLVYYWFQQRGRVLTNEYLVKWYVFWDALTRNRTDGALVRLIASPGPGQDLGDLDRILIDFARDIVALLPEYIPG